MDIATISQIWKESWLFKPWQAHRTNAKDPARQQSNSLKSRSPHRLGLILSRAAEDSKASSASKRPARPRTAGRRGKC